MKWKIAFLNLIIGIVMGGLFESSFPYNEASIAYFGTALLGLVVFFLINSGGKEK